MVRTQGPLFCEHARGHFGRVLTYRTRQNTPHVYRYATPAQPNSPLQVRHRNHYAWLASQWQTLSAGELDTWATASHILHHQPYNAFLSHNLRRWPPFLAPTKTFPARQHLPAATYSVLTPETGPDWLKVKWSVTEAATNWLYWLWLSDTPGIYIPQTDPTSRLILPGTGTKEHTYQPLAPGTWYYRLSASSDDGLWQHDYTEHSADVGAPPAECPTNLTMDLTLHAAWTEDSTNYEHTWHYTLTWQPANNRWYGELTEGSYKSSSYAWRRSNLIEFNFRPYYRYIPNPWRDATSPYFACDIPHPHTYTCPPWAAQSHPADTVDATLIY